jgi:hypothetical protein
MATLDGVVIEDNNMEQTGLTKAPTAVMTDPATSASEDVDMVGAAPAVHQNETSIAPTAVMNIPHKARAEDSHLGAKVQVLSAASSQTTSRSKL